MKIIRIILRVQNQMNISGATLKEFLLQTQTLIQIIKLVKIIIIQIMWYLHRIYIQEMIIIIEQHIIVMLGHHLKNKIKIINYHIIGIFKKLHKKKEIHIIEKLEKHLKEKKMIIINKIYIIQISEKLL